MSSASLLSSTSLVETGGDDLAFAQDGHRVGQGQGLLELVGDDEDGLAALLEPAQHLEQVRDLLRREHGRGLVQDEDLRLAVEGLEDLHALLGAHGEVLHLFPRVDVQAVFLGQGLHVRDGLFEVKAASLLRLVAEDHVLGHGHGLNEHEVLVHHGDAQLDGLERVFDLDGFALHADLAAGGRVHAIEDVHQCGLARAVFAEQRMDFAALDQQVDVAVRQHVLKLLGDAAHFNSVHCLSPFLSHLAVFPPRFGAARSASTANTGNSSRGPLPPLPVCRRSGFTCCSRFR